MASSVQSVSTHRSTIEPRGAPEFDRESAIKRSLAKRGTAEAPLPASPRIPDSSRAAHGAAGAGAADEASTGGQGGGGGGRLSGLRGLVTNRIRPASPPDSASRSGTGPSPLNSTQRFTDAGATAEELEGGAAEAHAVPARLPHFAAEVAKTSLVVFSLLFVSLLLLSFFFSDERAYDPDYFVFRRGERKDAAAAPAFSPTGVDKAIPSVSRQLALRARFSLHAALHSSQLRLVGLLIDDTLRGARSALAAARAHARSATQSVARSIPSTPARGRGGPANATSGGGSPAAALLSKTSEGLARSVAVVQSVTYPAARTTVWLALQPFKAVRDSVSAVAHSVQSTAASYRSRTTPGKHEGHPAPPPPTAAADVAGTDAAPEPAATADAAAVPVARLFTVHVPLVHTLPGDGWAGLLGARYQQAAELAETELARALGVREVRDLRLEAGSLVMRFAVPLDVEARTQEEAEAAARGEHEGRLSEALRQCSFEGLQKLLEEHERAEAAKAQQRDAEAEEQRQMTSNLEDCRRKVGEMSAEARRLSEAAERAQLSADELTHSLARQKRQCEAAAAELVRSCEDEHTAACAAREAALREECRQELQRAMDQHEAAATRTAEEECARQLAAATADAASRYDAKLAEQRAECDEQQRAAAAQQQQQCMQRLDECSSGLTAETAEQEAAVAGLREAARAAEAQTAALQEQLAGCTETAKEASAVCAEKLAASQQQEKEECDTKMAELTAREQECQRLAAVQEQEQRQRVRDAEERAAALQRETAEREARCQQTLADRAAELEASCSERVTAAAAAASSQDSAECEMRLQEVRRDAAQTAAHQQEAATRQCAANTSAALDAARAECDESLRAQRASCEAQSAEAAATERESCGQRVAECTARLSSTTAELETSASALKREVAALRASQEDERALWGAERAKHREALDALSAQAEARETTAAADAAAQCEARLQSAAVEAEAALERAAQSHRAALEEARREGEEALAAAERRRGEDADAVRALTETVAARDAELSRLVAALRSVLLAPAPDSECAELRAVVEQRLPAAADSPEERQRLLQLVADQEGAPCALRWRRTKPPAEPAAAKKASVCPPARSWGAAAQLWLVVVALSASAGAVVARRMQQPDPLPATVTAVAAPPKPATTAVVVACAGESYANAYFEALEAWHGCVCALYASEAARGHGAHLHLPNAIPDGVPGQLGLRATDITVARTPSQPPPSARRPAPFTASETSTLAAEDAWVSGASETDGASPEERHLAHLPPPPPRAPSEGDPAVRREGTTPYLGDDSRHSSVAAAAATTALSPAALAALEQQCRAALGVHFECLESYYVDLLSAVTNRELSEAQLHALEAAAAEQSRLVRRQSETLGTLRRRVAEQEQTIESLRGDLEERESDGETRVAALVREGEEERMRLQRTANEYKLEAERATNMANLQTEMVALLEEQLRRMSKALNSAEYKLGLERTLRDAPASATAASSSPAPDSTALAGVSGLNTSGAPQASTASPGRSSLQARPTATAAAATGAPPRSSMARNPSRTTPYRPLNWQDYQE